MLRALFVLLELKRVQDVERPLLVLDLGLLDDGRKCHLRRPSSGDKGAIMRELAPRRGGEARCGSRDEGCEVGFEDREGGERVRVEEEVVNG